MKPSHTYKGYPAPELFHLVVKVFFSAIVIANCEASFFVKALLVSFAFNEGN